MKKSIPIIIFIIYLCLSLQISAAPEWEYYGMVWVPQSDFENVASLEADSIMISLNPAATSSTWQPVLDDLWNRNMKVIIVPWISSVSPAFILSRAYYGDPAFSWDISPSENLLNYLKLWEKSHPGHIIAIRPIDEPYWNGPYGRSRPSRPPTLDPESGGYTTQELIVLRQLIRAVFEVPILYTLGDLAQWDEANETDIDYIGHTFASDEAYDYAVIYNHPCKYDNDMNPIFLIDDMIDTLRRNRQLKIDKDLDLNFIFGGQGYEFTQYSRDFRLPTTGELHVIADVVYNAHTSKGLMWYPWRQTSYDTSLYEHPELWQTLKEIGQKIYLQAYFDFTSDTEEWSPVSYPGIFSPPLETYSSSALLLTAQNNTDTVGFWSSPFEGITVSSGTVYFAAFRIFSDQAHKETVPQFRARVNTLDYQQADYVVCQSFGTADFSPSTSPQWYSVFFDIPETSGKSLLLSLDMINFDAGDCSTATLGLDSIVLDALPDDIFTNSSPVISYDFEESQQGWHTVTYPGIFQEPLLFYSNGALHISCTTNASLFGFWQSPTEILMEPNMIYKITAEVQSDVAELSTVPQLRLRIHTENEWASRVLVVESMGNGANSPGISPKEYSFYFIPPQSTSMMQCYLAFDMVNFTADDAAIATLSLNNISIQKYGMYWEE